jgi:hypothetical protein
MQNTGRKKRWRDRLHVQGLEQTIKPNPAELMMMMCSLSLQPLLGQIYEARSLPSIMQDLGSMKLCLF